MTQSYATKRRIEAATAWWRKLREDPVRRAQIERKRVESFKATGVRRREQGLLGKTGHVK